MGLTAKANAKNNNGSSTTSSSENWGTGFLLVFFPEDTSSIADKPKLSSSSPISSPSPCSSSSSSSLFPLTPNSSSRMRRLNSSLIRSKAQHTISICALLVFFTLLLFTLSTFEPTIPTPTTTTTTRRSRFLSQTDPVKLAPKSHLHFPFSFSGFFKFSTPNHQNHSNRSNQVSSSALQRMGILYRRGTRAMTDLLVAHVVEDVAENDFRLFLRALHRSGVTSRADVVFIFGSSSILFRFESLIREENDSFSRLIDYYRDKKGPSQKRVLGFDVAHFVKSGKKEMGEPLWGKKIRVNSSSSPEGEGESTRLSYGSVVGFEVNELDPENSLAGFLDHVPMSLRRWACYPMLLGRVRRNFKHIILVDVKNSVLLGDPLGRVRSRSPESVQLSIKPESSSSKHNKKNSDKTPSHLPVNSAILMGGARGIRRLSNAMLTEIVRAAMQHKKKNSITESTILSQLIGNGFILKSVDLITSTESIPDASSLSALSSNSAATRDYSIIQRGNSNHDHDSVIIMNQICSCEVDSSVYRDC